MTGVDPGVLVQPCPSLMHNVARCTILSCRQVCGWPLTKDRAVRSNDWEYTYSGWWVGADPTECAIGKERRLGVKKLKHEPGTE